MREQEKSFEKKVFILLLAGMVLLPSLGFCGLSRESLKAQADQDVEAATRFEQDGMRILQHKPFDRKTLAKAETLYIQAAQLFERAGFTYRGDINNIISSPDAEAAFRSRDNCLKIIAELEKKIQPSSPLAAAEKNKKV